jgi:5-hydroxyisourate hydrolase
MISITTHILDTARGHPAAGLAVTLWVGTGERWTELARANTGPDGRIPNMIPAQGPPAAAPGSVYRLSFAVAAYFAAQGIAPFYPMVDVVFQPQEDGHHHVPLLLSPFGYTTYRGS